MTGMDDDRRRIEELLPFYLNGTLDDVERAEVAAALDADETLQWELEFLQGVRDDVRSRETAFSPGEFGLARLMRDIDRQAAAPAPQAQDRRGGSNIWRIAAAAAIALFAAQAVVITTAPDFVAELAGGGAGGFDGPTLTVAFDEDATEAQIRRLLQQNDLVIIDGPSALGLYTLGAPDDAVAVSALAALGAADGIVESAERD